VAYPQVQEVAADFEKWLIVFYFCNRNIEIERILHLKTLSDTVVQRMVFLCSQIFGICDC